MSTGKAGFERFAHNCEPAGSPIDVRRRPPSSIRRKSTLVTPQFWDEVQWIWHSKPMWIGSGTPMGEEVSHSCYLQLAGGCWLFAVCLLLLAVWCCQCRCYYYTAKLVNSNQAQFFAQVRSSATSTPPKRRRKRSPSLCAVKSKRSRDSRTRTINKSDRRPKRPIVQLRTWSPPS